MVKGGRKYARDNRGRFASTGATARGGRLKTAGGNKRATVTVKAKGGGSGTVAKPKGLKPGTVKPKRQATPAGVPKVQLDKAAWQRRIQRIEKDKSGLARQGRGESLKKVSKTLMTRLNAERFIGGLLRNSKGPADFNQNFMSRPRHRGSSVSVAARNRQDDASRKSKRAASKQAKTLASAKPKAKAKPVVVGKPIRGTVKHPRVNTSSPGGQVLKGLMRGMPTVPTRRKPDYVDPKTGIKSTTLSFDQPKRLSGRQIASVTKTMEAQGWSMRSTGLGHEKNYFKSFDGPGGTSEIAKVRITRKGGPLASGIAEVTRSVSSRPGRRGGGGSVIEGRFGLRRKPRLNSKPRRRR